MRNIENIDDIDLRAMRVFLAVYDARNMTVAARDQGLTQSAVSQIVSKIERVLGVLLIDRSVRPMQPTPAGDLFAERARELLTNASTAMMDVRSLGTSTRPRMRLGMIDSIAGTIGAPLIRAIRADVREVSVWAGISPNLRQDLARGRLDLVVTSDPKMGADIQKSRLLREPFIAVVPKSFKAGDGPISPMRLAAGLPLVRYSVRSVIGDEIERELVRRGEVPPRVFEFDGTDGVFAMVAAGLGWAITTPICLAHGRQFGRDVKALPIDGPIFTREVHLLAANAVGAGLAKRVRAAALDIIKTTIETDIQTLAPHAISHMRVG